jgi:hypothetical protein
MTASINDTGLPMQNANPYAVGRPVSGNGRFFGQDRVLSTMVNSIVEKPLPSHLSLWGETRSGKTSLILELLRLEEKRLNERFCVIYLDMSGDFAKGSTQQFYCQFLLNTWEVIRNRAIDTKEIELYVKKALEGRAWGPTQIALKQTYQKIKNRGLELLYILDEFDETPRLFTKLDSQAFKYLRLMGEENNIVFFTSSRRKVVDIEQDAGISSNFAGLFEVDLNVPLLELSAAERLCIEPAERVGFNWPDRVVDRLIFLSGGHPFLLQSFCSQLYEELSNGCSPTEELVSDVTDRVFNRVFDDMMAHRLRRVGLYDSLAAAVRGGINGIPQEDVDMLCRLNYLVRVSEDQLRLFSPLLKQAIDRPSHPRVLSDHVELFQQWGIALGVYNVIVEGETDGEYFRIADLKYQEKHGKSLLDGIRVIPGGLGRAGGCKAVARRMVAVKEALSNKKTGVLAVLDNDAIGISIKKALDELGYHNKKDYLILDRSNFPIRDYDGPLEVEIEDLLSQNILERYRESNSKACEAVIDYGKRGRKLKWRGEFKDEMVDFIRENANLDDVTLIINLLKQIRNIAGLPSV